MQLTLPVPMHGPSLLYPPEHHLPIWAQNPEQASHIWGSAPTLHLWGPDPTLLSDLSVKAPDGTVCLTSGLLKAPHLVQGLAQRRLLVGALQ